MRRLVNKQTGVVVVVDEATAATLSADWQEPKPARKTSKKE
jgi:hypothetical protein|nr:MAG TPA: hypothetical protein [Caudoviricetes sp.]